MNAMTWKAMLWKEGRENGGWGLLTLLGMGIALAYAVSAANPPDGSGLTDKCAAVWNAANLVMTLGCPFFAALLGFAQVMPELRRDQWAFLVHRPVSRAVIFGGKAAVGLTLALAGAGLPFLVLVIWVATPGHVAAPFDARLTLPGIASLLTIVPFYFAGMLTALRPARWYGSRVLGLPAAGVGAVLVVTAITFWQAALAALFFGTILALAAWGSFLTRGQLRGQPKAAKAGLGTTLFFGVVVVVIGLTALGAILVQALTTSNGVYTYTNYSIDSQGRILRVTQSISRGGIQQTSTATDLAGKPVPLPQSLNGYPYQQVLQTNLLISPHREDNSAWSADRSGAYRSTSEVAEPLNQNDYGKAAWYYVPAQRRALGYDQTSRRVIGFLGPNGFSPARDASAPRFEHPQSGQFRWAAAHLFRDADAVYWLDPGVPTVTRLYAARQPGEIQGECEITGTNNRDRYGNVNVTTLLAAIAAANQFIVVTPQGRQLFTLPREHDPALYADVMAAMTPDGRRFFFWYYPSGAANPADPHAPAYITTVSAQGIVLHRDTLPPLPATPTDPPDQWQSAFGLLAPPVLPLALAAYAQIGHPPADTFAGSLRQAWNDPILKPLWHLFLAVSVAGGLVSAGLAWRIARRCGLSVRARRLWAIGVFWLGGYGVLTLLALREWPARLPCPQCKRPRSVERETCEYCGAPFERPRPDGTEIFDRADEDIPVEVVGGS